MAYLRWSSSIWYAYYHTNEYTSKDDQPLCIAMIRTFKYKELINDLEGCMGECRKINDEISTKKCTEKDLQELKDAMMSFIKDVLYNHELTEIETIRDATEIDLPLYATLNASLRVKKCFFLRINGKEIPAVLER